MAKVGSNEEAIPNYQFIVSAPQSEFSEEALNKLSQILLEKEDWTAAIPLLERLEQEANYSQNILYAQSNLMKGNYQLGNYEKAVTYAEKILLEDQIDASLEYDAKIVIARSAFQTEDHPKAEEFYREVERNASGELKAEALYYSAFFLNSQKLYADSNKVIQNITSDFSAYKYWGAKSFIIMAKNYYALENKDPYQATYILENIIKNFTQFDDIIIEAKNELKKIKLNEAKTNNSVITPQKLRLMKKYITCFLVLASAVVMAQRKSKKEKKKDTITPPVITVVTSYTPTIADASKIKKIPVITLSDNSKKKKLDYKIFSAPVASTFVPKSGVVKGIDVGKKERLFSNYVAGGYGNFNTPYLEAFLQQNRKFEYDYGVYLKYISSGNGVEITPLDNGYTALSLGAYYTKEDRYFTWKIGGNITRNQYHWYGLPAIDFDAESIAAIDEKQAYGFYELEGEFIFKNTTIDKIKGALNMFDDLFGSQEIQFRLLSSFTFP